MLNKFWCLIIVLYVLYCLIFSDLEASELAFFSPLPFFLASLASNLSSGLSSPPVSRVLVWWITRRSWTWGYWSWMKAGSYCSGAPRSAVPCPRLSQCPPPPHCHTCPTKRASVSPSPRGVYFVGEFLYLPQFILKPSTINKKISPPGQFRLKFL